MPRIPTNRVFLSTNILIDGIVSSQNFSKKNYKFSKLIKMKYEKSNNDDFNKQTKLSLCLNQMTKKLQYLQGLNLGECAPYLLQSSSKILKLIKHFRNIKSVTTPIHHLSKITLQTILLWLKISKTLKSLSCSSLMDHTIFSKGKISYEKLFGVIKRSKLDGLNLNLSNAAAKELKPFLLFDYFPTTLKRLSLDWETDNFLSTSLKQLDRFSYDGILSQYPNLEALMMKMPINLDVLKVLEGTKGRFTNFRSLDLRIQDSELQDKDYLKQAQKIFQKWNHLENLSIIFSESLPSLNILNTLHTCPLKHLFLALPLENEKQLSLLGDFIGKLEHLKTLKLKITGDISSNASENFKKNYSNNASECFKKFYNSLSQLRNIRALDLCILIARASKSTKVPGVVKNFAQCVNNFQRIEELALKHVEANFVDELSDLLQVLSNKAKILKRFEINLEGQLLRQNALMQIVQFVQSLKLIDILALDQLTFDGKRFGEKFSRALIESKSLRVLRIFSANGKIDHKILREMIIGILTKPNFETLFFSESREFKRLGEVKTMFPTVGVNASELISKNPKLRYIAAPSDIVFLNTDILISKWW